MEPASTHLRASLELPAAGRVRDTLQWLGSMLGGMFEMEPPATIELVISRKDTGATVMRHTIDNTIEADFALDSANRDLERMTVAEFITAWREQAEPATSGDDPAAPEKPAP